MITKLFGRISTLFFQSRPTSPPPIINNYCNVQPPIIPTPPISRDSRVMVLDDSARMKMFTFIKFY